MFLVNFNKWLSILLNIIDQVMQCLSTTKPQATEDIFEFASIPVKTEVWNQLGMDLVGPLQQTPRGNRYMMTVIIQSGLRLIHFEINPQLQLLEFFTRLVDTGRFSV